ncbi:hypothetical protein [Aestuariicoccus sp. MJ-SS9]|uniref:hypothetical protein n=1 Tax=Aestuariicoccus sp. MJ-SS9 TaxID=3079855 RepID=UPI0029109A5E|nr:hypothetical protein [Aestuariicoccus sp. MJ-SS9]MDU8912252.1 hypothetical protein [Aestuariicoccus sp. MJ-SS9]
MARTRNTLAKPLLMAALALSLMLAMVLPETSVHTGESAHQLTHAAGETQGHTAGDEPASAHTGCHATALCTGAVLASQSLRLSPVRSDAGAALGVHDFSFSSIILNFDPPPPRLS